MGLLDDLDGKIEEENALASKKNKSQQKMINNIEKEYEKFKKWFKKAYSKLDIYSIYKKTINNKIDFSLTPEAIECFIRTYNKFNPSKKGDHILPFSSILIQNSYNQGHNDFSLPAIIKSNDATIEFAYNYLYGSKIAPLNIIIKNSVVHSSCNRIKYANIKFLKETDHGCANSCVCSNITFNINTYEGSAQQCIESKIVFNDFAGDGSAINSSKCDVYFYGDIDKYCGSNSKSTIFYSPHIKNLKQVAKTVSEGCSFYLIEGDGNHTEVHFK